MIFHFKYFLFTLLFFCSCIIKTPERTEHDLYDSDKNYLIRKDVRTNTKYIEISAKDIKLLNPKEIYLFATWCAPCLLELKSNKEKFSEIMLVSLNYNISSFEKYFPNTYDTIYILDNHVYGGQEKVKLSNFIFDLTGEKDESYSIPKIFHRGKQDNSYYIK